LIDLRVLEDARSLMCGKFGLFIKMFLEDSQFNINNLKRIAEIGRPAEEAILPAHMLKIAAIQVGAVKMADMAGRLEARASQVVKGGTTSMSLMPLIADIENIYMEVRQKLLGEMGAVEDSDKVE